MSDNKLANLPPTSFKDISHVELNKKDLVVFDDRKNGVRYTFEVLEVLPLLKEGSTIRRYRMLVRESTNPAIVLGTEIKDFRVDQAKVVWGQVYRHDEHVSRMAIGELEDFCVIELRKYLDRDPDMKCRFQTAVQYLIRIGALREEDGDTPHSYNYKFVQGICQRYKKLIVSRGGWVRSTGMHVQLAEHEFGGEGGRGLITVDFRMLVLGLRHILESISIIRVKNAE